MILVYRVHVLSLVNYCHKSKEKKMNNDSFIIPYVKQLLINVNFQNFKIINYKQVWTYKYVDINMYIL